MTKIEILCTAIAFIATTHHSMGQQIETQTSIVEQLQLADDSTGSVAIYQDTLLTQRIGGVCIGDQVQWRGDTAYLTTKGYRIQVLSDNNQRLAKEEAIARETLIKEFDSSLATYITFTSPFWRLRVGNYRSYEEANKALRTLSRKFPKYRGEMRILEDSIELPIYTQTPTLSDTVTTINSYFIP